jgi:hypothetical protein
MWVFEKNLPPPKVENVEKNLPLNPKPQPNPTQNEKNQGTLSACRASSHLMCAISLPKIVHHHFWPFLAHARCRILWIDIKCFGVPHKFNFCFFAISYFDGQKKVETMEAPQK